MGIWSNRKTSQVTAEVLHAQHPQGGLPSTEAAAEALVGTSAPSNEVVAEVPSLPFLEELPMDAIARHSTEELKARLQQAQNLVRCLEEEISSREAQPRGPRVRFADETTTPNGTTAIEPLILPTQSASTVGSVEEEPMAMVVVQSSRSTTQGGAVDDESPASPSTTERQASLESPPLGGGRGS